MKQEKLEAKVFRIGSPWAQEKLDEDALLWEDIIPLLEENERLMKILAQRRELILSLCEELGDFRAGVYDSTSIAKLRKAQNSPLVRIERKTQ